MNGQGGILGDIRENDSFFLAPYPGYFKHIDSKPTLNLNKTNKF